MKRPQLYIKQILAWADRHRELTGKWPEQSSGRVLEVLDEKWANIDTALRQGFRGLRPGSSLARLLAERRGKRNRKALPKYTIRQILQWADEYYAAHGRWPNHGSGAIAGTNGETWQAVGVALHSGIRGLRGGNSLARLLAARRGKPHPLQHPRLSIQKILAWADAYHRRTGFWPKLTREPVTPHAIDTWLTINKALGRGARGLPAGQSLAKVLKTHRGVSRHVRKRPFSQREILSWIDAHYARTGKWPSDKSGPIPEADGATWVQVNDALRLGKRGLPGGTSLAKLLGAKRGVRNRFSMPRLTQRQILHWARLHYQQHGVWPNRASGPIPGSGGETWCGVDLALKRGGRGLLTRISLPQLLAQQARQPNGSRPR